MCLCDQVLRWANAREFRVCAGYFSSSHRSATCRRAKRCPIKGCPSNDDRLPRNGGQRGIFVKHNFPEEPQTETIGSTNTISPRNCTEGEPGTRTFVTSITEDNEDVPLRTVPIVVEKGSKSLCINALLDDRSTRSYIIEDVTYYWG